MHSKTRLFTWTAVALAIFTTLQAAPSANTLTAKEKKQGWTLLFDGNQIEGWRSYDSNTFPKDGWVVENGTIHKQAGKRPGDIMTVNTYENFEFKWDWKLSPGGNSGVKYFIIPERKATVGHEYQMIDDTIVKDDYSSNASFYLVVKPRKDKPNKPVDQWNNSRIVVQGNHVEHWLNDIKVLEYECGSPEVMNQVPKTKFKNSPRFGEKVIGHILLTDHNDPSWFRNLKIRELK